MYKAYNIIDKVSSLEILFWGVFMKRFLLFAFAILSTCSVLGAVTGPSQVRPGYLVTFTSDVPGDFMVFPPGKGSFAKDSNKTNLYFVSTQTGQYSLIHFGVQDGQPVITTHDFVVGEVTPAPEPEPEPEPGPSPIPDITKLTSAEKEAVIYALTYTISSIENGSVTTPQGARSTFKQALTQKGTVCDGRTCQLRPALSKLLDEWSNKANFESLDAMKESFEAFLKEVRK